jgi:hypothetical protein
MLIHNSSLHLRFALSIRLIHNHLVELSKLLSGEIDNNLMWQLNSCSAEASRDAILP